jgi:hypothetical protein
VQLLIVHVFQSIRANAFDLLYELSEALVGKAPNFLSELNFLLKWNLVSFFLLFIRA